MAALKSIKDFEKFVKISAQDARNTPGTRESSVEGTSNAITEIVMAEKNKPVYAYGKIHQILPVGDKIRVSAYRIERKDYVPEDFEHGTGHDVKRMFNTFGPMKSDTLFLPMFIPVLNLDMTKDSIDLKTLIGKKVKLKLIAENVATEAELISDTPRDLLHSSGIRLKDLDEAYRLNIPTEEFLLSIGYDEDLVKDFFKLKEEDYQESGILRFLDEAYWDKDVSKNKDFDIVIEEDKIPLGIIGRNYIQMKEKLCHMPLIMFSGK